MKTEVGEGLVICPKCGEVNSTNFLFCGMCGTILEPARKASIPAADPVPVTPPAAEYRPFTAISPDPVPATPPTPPTPPSKPPQAAAPKPVPPIGGPSVLGLGEPNVDVLRGRAFSGLDSYGESAESGSRRSRILLMLLLLAALGGGYWWTYKNYLSVADGRKPAASVTSPAGTTSAPPSAGATDGTATTGPEGLPPRTGAERNPPVVTPDAPHAKKNLGAAAPNAKASTPLPTAARHEVSAERVSPTKPAAEPTDTGDALFRQGERYLYGRGGAQDCANAIKYLKQASDKQNPKARSAMGTMYATGHCVPRDLPSAYRWFALALRVDPNNTVVEKNLSGVWNQMTPPERQLATKSSSQ